MVRFNCPGCRVVLKAADRHVGAAMPCPNCGRRLFVPGPLPAGASVPPPSRLPLLLGGAGAALLLVIVIAAVFAFPYPRGGRPGPAQASAGQPPAGAAAPSFSKSAGPGSPAGPADAERPEGRKYALLVGVKTYKKDQLKSLQFTENDVNEIAPALREAGYRRVVLMTQSESIAQSDGELDPTARNIRKKFQGLLEDLKPEDTILVAFSGHGLQFNGDKGSYFCPADAEVGDRNTLVSLADVYKGMEESKADLKVLLVDACRNDPLASLGKGVEVMNVASVTRPQAERPPGGVAALFSCSEGQQSYESPKLKHGVFFHFVIQGLQGKAANKRGEVTLTGLTDYVMGEVPVQVKEDIGDGARQRPQLVGALSGAVPLVRIAVAAKTEPAATEAKPKDPGPTATKDKPPDKPPVTEEMPKDEITNSIGMRLKRIPAGAFTMGSPPDEGGRFANEGPQHAVMITRPFSMGVSPVTVRQFATFCKDAPYQTEAETDGTGGNGYGADHIVGMRGRDFSWWRTGWEQTDDDPVVNVTWNDAVEFCKWLFKKEGKVYELPTEAEWEYACRAGTKTRFWCGDTDDSLQGNANIADASLKRKLAASQIKDWTFQPWDDDYPFTSPAGKFKANPWGLYDMHGNVRQWCADWYAADYYKDSPMKDPRGLDSGKTRTIRGGSWFFAPYNNRSAYRSSYEPGARFSDVGFRVVLRPAAGAP